MHVERAFFSLPRTVKKRRKATLSDHREYLTDWLSLCIYIFFLWDLKSDVFSQPTCYCWGLPMKLLWLHPVVILISFEPGNEKKKGRHACNPPSSSNAYYRWNIRIVAISSTYHAGIVSCQKEFFLSFKGRGTRPFLKNEMNVSKGERKKRAPTLGKKTKQKIS